MDMEGLSGEQVVRLAHQFWENVLVQPGDCWLWTGKIDACGYGYMPAWTFVQRGALMAHRVSYFLAMGYEPRPVARHLCHTPACVHPGHLVQGTKKDNANDRRARLTGVDLLALNREGRL